MAKVSFYKLTNVNASALPIKEGQVIFVTDTKRLYLDDANNSRIEMTSYDLTQDINDNHILTFTRPDGTSSSYTIPDHIYTGSGHIEIDENNIIGLDEETVNFLDGDALASVNGSNIYLKNVQVEDVYKLELDKESTQETTTGKNLYNSNYRNNGIINTSNGTTSESNGEFSLVASGTDAFFWYQNTSGNPYSAANGPLIEVESGVTYSITITNSEFNNNFLVFYDEDKISKGFSNKTNSFTYTPSETIKYISMRIGLNNAVVGNTYKTKIQVEKGTATQWEEYTGGQPSPNPDYPQEVNTVKGIVNLYDKTTNSIMNTSNTRLQTNGYIALPAGTYTISYTGNVNQLYILYYDSNHTKIGESNWFSGSVTFTYNQDYEYKFTFRKSGDSSITSSDIDNIQIVEGTEAKPYVPYGNNYVSVKITGKNLYNINKYPLTLNRGLNSNTGEIYVTTSGNYYATVDYIPFDYGNKEIAKSQGISMVFYDENKNYILYFQTANEHITVPSNTKYIRFDVNKDYINVIQIEQSSTATSYEPYKESNVPIPLNGNKIVGIGDHKDELLVDKNGHCWLNKVTGKLVLDGTETWWVKGTTQSSGYSYFYTSEFDGIITDKSYLMYSNYFGQPSQKIVPSYITDKPVISGTNSLGEIIRLRILIPNSIASDVNTFKAWLLTHNTSVYYVLKTPELIDLQTTVGLTLFKGVNNVSNSEDANMKIYYYNKSIDGLYNNLSDRIDNINYIDKNEKGSPGGVGELDENGILLTSQMPSYVDDVLEYANQAAFPSTGESGKIYVALDTNKTYRWSGTTYTEISPSLALGETSATAYRGDRGKAAYDHAVTNKGIAAPSNLYKITTNSEGHVTNVTTVVKSDIVNLGIPGSADQGIKIENNVIKMEDEPYHLLYDDGETETEENTNLYIEDALEGKIKELTLNKESSQEVITAEQGAEVINKNIYVNDVNTTKENYITLKGDTAQETTTGKNLLNSNINTITLSGVTISYDSDTQEITLNGTATNDDTSFSISNNNVTVPENSTLYSRIKYIRGSTSGYFHFQCYTSSWGLLFDTIGNGMTSDVTNLVTVTDERIYSKIRVRANTGTVFNNFKFKLYLSLVDNVYEPYTNGPSPNPDYPQEVKTVKGYRNEINLNRTSGVFSGNGTIFEESKYYPYMVRDSGNVGATGEMISCTDDILTIRGRYEQGVGYPIKCKPNQSYFIKTTSTSENARLWVSFYDNTGTYISGSTQNTALERTVTAPNNAYWIIPIFAVSGGSFSNISFNQIMVFESNQELPYVPYGNNVNVKTTGKNLLNINNVNSAYQTTYEISNNQITVTNTGAYSYIRYKINTTIGTTYTASLKYTNNDKSNLMIYIRNSQNQDIAYSNGVANTSGNLNVSFTATTKQTYVVIYSNSTSTSNQKVVIFEDLQLEQGSTATTYEPYQGQYYPIKMNNIELCKIDTYQDYFYKQNGLWYLHKEINKIILNGSESNWSLQSEGFMLPISDISNNTKKLYSNLFKNYLTSTEFLSQNFGISKIWSEVQQIYIRNSNITSTENFKTWLSTHNTEVYYVLATPTNIQISDTELISQLDTLYTAQIHPITNIMSYSDLEPYIDLKYNVITPAPSPDKSSEVKTIKGYSNLFDKTTITQNYYFNNNGEIVSHFVYCITDYIMVNPNEQYVYSGIINYNSSTKSVYYDKNKNKISVFQQLPGSNVITIPSNARYVRFTLVNSSTQTLDSETFQLVEGDQQLPYVPYGNNYVNVKITGKNYANFGNETITKTGVTLIPNGSELTLNGTATAETIFNFTSLKDYINNNLNNKNINISCIKDGTVNGQIILWLSKEGTWFWRNLDLSGNNNISISSLPTVDSVRIVVNNNTTLTNLKLKIQIEEGSATSYEPYHQESNVPLPLNGNEIAGIGEYLDEYIVDKNGHCWLNKVIEKIVLDGTEEWYGWGVTGARGVNLTLKGISYSSGTQIVDGYSTHFKPDGRTNIYNNVNDNRFSYSDTTLWVRHNSSSTLAEFKTWLSTHNTEVYYVLETSQLIDLNTTVDVRLFKGINNIINSEDANMKIKYLNISLNGMYQQFLDITGLFIDELDEINGEEV